MCQLRPLLLSEKKKQASHSKGSINDKCIRMYAGITDSSIFSPVGVWGMHKAKRIL